MNTRPAHLYGRDDLFDRWSDDDVLSWARSFDGATYLRAVRNGLRAPHSDQVATERALHDTAITRLLHHRLRTEGCRPAAVMGGHDAARGSATYVAAARLGAALSRRGLTVLTGGGPGAMEGTHLGARLSLEDVDEAVAQISHDEGLRSFPLGPNDLVVDGEFVVDALAALHRWQLPAIQLAVETDDVARETIGIPTWIYGHEPPTPLATHHAKYFQNSIREDGLLAEAVYGIVYLPGTAGTLQELFQDAAQNHYRLVRDTFSPMVFFDLGGYWSERFPIRPVIEALLADDDRELVCWTDDIAEAVEFIDAFRIPD